MEKFYVMFDDCYGIKNNGWQSFDYEAQAITFIETRMSLSEKPNLLNYKIVRGRELTLKEVERVTKVEVQYV